MLTYPSGFSLAKDATATQISAWNMGLMPDALTFDIFNLTLFASWDAFFFDQSIHEINK